MLSAHVTLVFNQVDNILQQRVVDVIKLSMKSRSYVKTRARMEPKRKYSWKRRYNEHRNNGHFDYFRHEMLLPV